MNRKTIPAIKAPLSFLAAMQDQTPDAAFNSDFQELYSLAMDQAIGIEKASFDAVVRMQSCVIDVFENASCFSPALVNLFDLAAQAITSCLELQLTWLAMMASCANQKTEPLLHVVAPGRKVASNALRLVQPPAEALEHSMDIAIGARAA
jgi:hypothetical protein